MHPCEEKKDGCRDFLTLPRMSVEEAYCEAGFVLKCSIMLTWVLNRKVRILTIFTQNLSRLSQEQTC